MYNISGNAFSSTDKFLLTLVHFSKKCPDGFVFIELAPWHFTARVKEKSETLEIHINLVHCLARSSLLSNGPYNNLNYKSASPKSKRINLINTWLGSKCVIIMANVSQEAISMDSKMYNRHFQECESHKIYSFYLF